MSEEKYNPPEPLKRTHIAGKYAPGSEGHTLATMSLEGKKSIVLHALAMGLSERAAAGAVGHTKRRVELWRKEDEEFEMAYRFAFSDGEAFLVEAIREDISRNVNGNLAQRHLEWRHLQIGRERHQAQLRKMDAAVRKEDKRKRRAEADLAEEMARLAREAGSDEELKRLEAATGQTVDRAQVESKIREEIEDEVRAEMRAKIKKEKEQEDEQDFTA